MKKIGLFVLTAYAAVWLLVGALWLAGVSIASPLWAVMAAVCMFMPLIATAITQLVNGERVLRAVGWSWRMNRWWAVAWLLPAVMTVAMLAVAGAMPGVSLTMESPMMKQVLAQVNAALPGGMKISPMVFILSQVANGFIAGITLNAVLALGEEVGWRGYLLKQFAGRRFLPTALIIGAIWGLWHAPLVMMGLNFPHHPYVGIAVMTVACMCLAPVVQFIRVKSGSVIAAAVFHGSFNAFATFVPLFLTDADELLTGPMGLAGMIVMVLTLAVLHLCDRKILTSTISNDGVSK